MRSLEIENKKSSMKLTDIQRETLIGLLLGDAHLETQNKGRTYRIKFEYSVKQREYLDHLYELFEEWTLSPPRTKSDSTHNNVCFQTVSHSAFRFYAHQFYDERKKRVPENIHRFLTPRAIAYWYMDDGSIKSKDSKGVIFNTQCFTREEVARLVEALQRDFGLEAKERRQPEGWQIYISGKSYERFREIVDPYVIDSMRYKIPTDRSSTKMKSVLTE
jgi:LAGLIDADG DNA endonuclease family protein